ncbi:MAG: FAD-dependent oxidoreductase, partial [Bacteroidota bacterium]|nr:FAD-dependent oxidoreductase [Bacteroidota bacterium]
DIQYDRAFGKDITLEQLQQNFDAVYLGIGVGLANKLNIAGEDMEGVKDAIKFIYEIRTQGFPNVPVGDSVAVIGMGMTAIDAATQAKRLGAKEVTMIYRRSEAEKNCTQVELDIALLDGCKIQWLAAPKEIKGDNGKVKQLICELMELGAPDFSGKPAPIATGETFTLDVDMVIKATGQSPFIDLVSENGIENNRGKIILKENSLTNIKGIFAGGDAVNGGKEVVDAVQAGKDGAAAILQYLSGNI